MGKKPEDLVGLTDVENGWAPELVKGNPEKGIRGFEADDLAALSGKAVHIESEPVNVGDEIRFFETKKLPLHDSKGVIIGVLGVARDITDRIRAQEELARYRDQLEEMVDQRSRELELSHEALRRAERLVSIGTLAAGIAHEINNPLGLILLRAENALQVEDSAGYAEALRGIVSDTRRCKHIVKNALKFSREEPGEKWRMGLNEVVQSSCDLTREFTQQNGVAIELDLSGEEIVISGNSTELEQVIVNLIHNAVQASTAGSVIRLRTSSVAGNARLEVYDHGRGMSPEEQSKAFDPFYTTRAARGGTGLGLSVSHGIVSEHGGSIDVESAPGEGTRVTIILPEIRAEAS
ncbi:MAG: PAS domain-containing protein [Myxococcales bacterium]|nr:PAS domain-containing protein [Myxococcales bacterium]